MYSQTPAIISQIKDNSINDGEKAEIWFLNHTWNRQKMFEFFGQNNIEKASFPCLTIGGTKSGFPCDFPFIYNGKVHYNCSYLDDVNAWCSTRTFLNHSHILNNYGYCPDHCNGQFIFKNSIYNLADDYHHLLWEEDIYSLEEFGSGYCVTYNPPGLSPAGWKGRLFAFLGQNKRLRMLDGYKVYVHDKGQFWPGSEMERIGLSEIKILPNYETEGEFTVVETTNLNRPDAPCSLDVNYSFKSCILQYVQKDAGCSLSWTRNSLNHVKKDCSTVEEILSYASSLKKTTTFGWSSLLEKTGCIPKCTVRKYNFNLLREEKMTWRRNITSAFYLAAKRSLFRKEEEFWMFQFFDAINGIGGALGLCLGWSGIYIVERVLDFVRFLLTVKKT